MSTQIGRCGIVAQQAVLRTCRPGECRFEPVVAPEQFVADGERGGAEQTPRTGLGSLRFQRLFGLRRIGCDKRSLGICAGYWPTALMASATGSGVL